jgi:hypothetical protein
MYPIYLQVCAGLANRLRSTVSGICGAEDLSRNIVISWPPEEAFGGTWDELFEPIEHPWVTTAITNYSERLHMCLSPKDWDTEKTRPTIIIKSYGHFHQSDEERWLRYFRGLRPKAEVVAKLDKLFDGKTAVGIHIRRTDNTHSIKGSPTSAFFDVMDTYPPGTLFYVATDDIKERYAVLNRYPGRLLPRATLSLERHTLEGVEGAVLDFFALSRCTEILGSAASSFSELAGLYSGIPVRTIRVP